MTYHIEAHNMGEIRSAVLDLTPGLNFLIGHNAAGKTTLLRAIGAAGVRRTKIYGATKTDAAWLVTRGMSSGLVTVANGSGASVSIEWPGGDPAESGPSAPHLSTVAAGLEDPTAMRGDRWLQFLADLLPSAYRITEKTIVARLSEIGVDADEAAEIAKNLDNGSITWAKAEQHFEQVYQSERRAWERLANDRYGSTKVVSWRPSGWRSELESIDPERTRKTIEAARRRVVTISVEGAADRLADLHEQRRALDDEARSLRREADDLRRDDLPRGGPDVSGKGGTRLAFTCTQCGTGHDLRLAGHPPRLDPWVEPKGPTKAELAAAATAEAERVAAIDRITARMQQIEIELATVERQIAEARQPPEPSDDARAAEALAAQLATDLALHEQFLEARVLAGQARINREAADACALGGIRRSLLVQGIEGWLNPMLAQWSGYLFSGREPVGIDTGTEDFALMLYGDEPIARHLWGDDRNSSAIRCQWLLQLVTVMVDESSFALLDYGDVVELQYLGGLLDLLDHMHLTALLAMTRDDPATAAVKLRKVPRVGQVHVVEDGRVG